MNAEYSYQGRLREGVVFLFVDGQRRVLIEHRPSDGSFFPNGSIEVRDHAGTSNYQLSALLREVGEEFGGQVTPLELSFLQTDAVPEIGVVFHTYVVPRWAGTFPAYSTEDGQPFARLEWVPLDEYRQHLKYESARRICEGLLGWLGN